MIGSFKGIGRRRWGLASAPGTEIERILADGAWLAHRFNPESDLLTFLAVPREQHRAAVFLTDEYLPKDLSSIAIPRSEAFATMRPDFEAPLSFIFHSAFCCSTLLARAFDVEGVSLGLKEPVILNDLVGWKLRGADRRELAAVLDNSLKLLARPISPGEAVLLKPSNIVNCLAPAILAMRPASNALLLHAPLRVFLRSIAKKGIDGRLWAREALIIFLEHGVVDLGFSSRDYLGHTDLQAAAVGWLGEHALFDGLISRYGANRVRSLDSESLIAHPRETIAALADHFGIVLDGDEVDRIVDGPAFNQHSKIRSDFGAGDRASEHLDAAEAHADEIEKVAIWAEVVARNAGISLTLGAPLFKAP